MERTEYLASHEKPIEALLCILPILDSLGECDRDLTLMYINQRYTDIRRNYESSGICRQQG